MSKWTIGITISNIEAEDDEFDSKVDDIINAIRDLNHDYDVHAGVGEEDPWEEE